MVIKTGYILQIKDEQRQYEHPMYVEGYDDRDIWGEPEMSYDLTDDIHKATVFYKDIDCYIEKMIEDNVVQNEDQLKAILVTVTTIVEVQG